MEEAKASFEEAIVHHPDNADNYFNLGNVYLSLTGEPNFTQAHRNFDRALELEPRNSKLHHAKGLAYQAKSEFISLAENGKHYNLQEDQENVQLAIENFKNALEHCETFISSMFHLGLMYRRTGMFHDALYQFTKVSEKLSNDKTVYIQRGLVYQDMGNNWQAIADFERAIALDETYSPAHFYLGISRLNDHKPKEALVHFERALDLDTNKENPGIFDGLARCFHRLGRYGEAIEEFKNALNLEKEKGNPYPVEFLKNYAQCYFDMQDYEQSIYNLD